MEGGPLGDLTRRGCGGAAVRYREVHEGGDYTEAGAQLLDEHAPKQ
jgi:hypothetical protein